MKKLIPMLLLVGLSTNVFAEWTKVATAADDSKNAYFDFATIRKKGNKVKAWVMDDFKTVQEQSHGENKHLSAITRSEYNCEEDTTKQLDINWYSENMGMGGIIVSISNIKEEPRSIIPGSIGETVFKIACGIK